MKSGENRNGGSMVHGKKSGEARRPPRRPYVRPSIESRDLTHVVQGNNGTNIDPGGVQTKKGLGGG